MLQWWGELIFYIIMSIIIMRRYKVSLKKFVENNAEDLDELPVGQVANVGGPPNETIQITNHKSIQYLSSMLKITSILDIYWHNTPPSIPSTIYSSTPSLTSLDIFLLYSIRAD